MEKAGREKAVAFLQSQGCSDETCQRVGLVIQRVSFHDELGRTEEEKAACAADKVLCIVQDADRLDALGAVVRQQVQRIRLV